MLFEEVRMHLATWRIGEEPTVGTLSRMITDLTGRDHTVKPKNRMLGGRPILGISPEER